MVGATKTSTKVVTGIKAIAGIAEISTDSVNILLKIFGANDTELGKEISKYLFYFEMAALSGEVSVALYSKMQASARKIIAKEEAIKATAKNADEAKQIDEMFEGLKKVANKTIKETVKQMWTDFKYSDLFPPPKPCFLAGTLVKTENGLIAIEKIETGTKVLSYNLDKQKTEYQTLLQTFTHFAEKYIEIHTESEVLEVTGAHLFYIPDTQKWIAASQLTTAMHLMNENRQKAAIKALNIIKKEVPTYNIEVAENHNYFVGKNRSILTHNEAKKLKFTSEILYDFEFYTFLDLKDKPLYVGQTTQGYDIRICQHFKDYENHPIKKLFVEFRNPKQIIINSQIPPYKMTQFEAAVTEMYELQLRGGKRNGELGLFNKKNPTARRTFDRIKKDFPNFNPCRFYV